MPRPSGGKKGNVIEMQPWTPRGDPILALLPAEHPWAFDQLPFEEQQWRARVFLTVWIQTDGTMFAWSQALQKDPDDAEIKAWVLKNLTDEVILDGLRSRQQPPGEPSG
jgi:hypothetical protein